MSVTFEQAAAAVREVEALTGEKLVDARRAVNALRGGASPSRNVTGRSKSPAKRMRKNKRSTPRKKNLRYIDAAANTAFEDYIRADREINPDDDKEPRRVSELREAYETLVNTSHKKWKEWLNKRESKGNDLLEKLQKKVHIHWLDDVRVCVRQLAKINILSLEDLQQAWGMSKLALDTELRSNETPRPLRRLLLKLLETN